MQKYGVFVGTYSEDILFGSGNIFHGKGKGIYLLEFCPEDGALQPLAVYSNRNPSFLCADRSGKRVLAVNELKDVEGADGAFGGGISSFTFDEKTLSLEPQSFLPTQGGDPCHVSLGPDEGMNENLNETYVFVSNYDGGSLAFFSLSSDGKLSAGPVARHTGSGVHPRQTLPHVHAAVSTPDGRFLFAADLGCDRLVRYRLRRDEGNSKGNSCKERFWPEQCGGDLLLPPGSGPRQAVFSRDGRYCYVADELSGCVSAAALDGEKGVLSLLQTLPAVSNSDDEKENVCADVKLSLDGKWVYLSNKGRNDISIYRRCEHTGLLTPVGAVPCGGVNPRNFTLDPTGRWLLCANQDTDNIVVFSVHPETGVLAKAREFVIPTPVCLTFISQRL